MLPDQTRNHPALELLCEVLENLQRKADSYDTMLNEMVIDNFGTCIWSRVATGSVLSLQGDITGFSRLIIQDVR